MKRSDFHIALSVIALITIYSVAAAQTVTLPTFRVGAILPLSGPLASGGQQLVKGAQLAQEYLRNEGQSDLVDRIQLEWSDSGSSAAQALSVVEKKLQARSADLFLGALTSSSTYLIAQTLMDGDKPLVVPAASRKSLWNEGAKVLRTCLSDDDQAVALARFAALNLRRLRAGVVIEEGSSYGKTMQDAFERAFPSFGGQTLIKITLPTKDPQAIQAAIKSLNRASVDVVFAPLHYSLAQPMIDEAHQQRSKLRFLGSDAWHHPSLWDQPEQALKAQGHYFIRAFSPLDPGVTVQRFVEKYKSRHQIEPGLYAALGYDSYMYLAQALSHAKSTLASQVHRALLKAGEIEGVGGPFRVNQLGEVEKQWVVLATTSAGVKFEQRIRGKGPVAIR